MVARHIFIGITALLWALNSPPAFAEERFLLEGLLDAEVFETDSGSRLLSRNEGDPASRLQLQLWSAFQISNKFQVYALGELRIDNSKGGRDEKVDLQQFTLRYSAHADPGFYIEAGKLLSPFGAYSRRRLSTINPLIGEPESYYVTYPLGIKLAGSASWLDYRVAWIDLPEVNPRYVPDHGAVLRPELGLGITPLTGLRFGASYSKGPYLSRQVKEYLLPGSSWKDFDQRLVGLDVQFSRGYLEFNGELLYSSYDVPAHSNSTGDTSYYLELKYTWTPRFYGALRFEKNEYTYIHHLSGTSWLSEAFRFHDVEVGLGYRFSADTQVKISYRRDYWDVERAEKYAYPNGHSVALQLSHHFDVKSWFAPKL